MGKLTKVVNTFNNLTGVNGRHNKALSEVSEWTTRVQDVLSRYGLLETGADFDALLQKVGEAKVDLTSLTYNGHTVVRTARAIRSAEVSPLVGKVVEELEEVRRALINPSFIKVGLEKSVPGLQTSFQEMQSTLSRLEYR